MADSAHSGKSFSELLSLDVFRCLVHNKNAHSHPLGDVAKRLLLIKTAIRTYVEHVFERKPAVTRPVVRKGE